MCVVFNQSPFWGYIVLRAFSEPEKEKNDSEVLLQKCVESLQHFRFQKVGNLYLLIPVVDGVRMLLCFHAF